MLSQTTGKSTDLQQQQQLIMTDYGTVQNVANEEPDAVEPGRFHSISTPTVSKLDSNNCEMQPLTSANDVAVSSTAQNDAALVGMTPQDTRSVTNVTPTAQGKPCGRYAQRFNSWAQRVGPNCLSNTDIQKHKKIILISFFFCVFGLVLCSIGTALTANQPEALYNLVFVIGGLVIFIPGIYYLVYIIRAYYGHEGYSFEDLPPMD